MTSNLGATCPETRMDTPESPILGAVLSDPARVLKQTKEMFGTNHADDGGKAQNLIST